MTTASAWHDIHQAVQGVIQAGGEVMGEPMLIPGIGQYASIKDTEGNRVGMLQPLPRGATPHPA